MDRSFEHTVRLWPEIGGRPFFLCTAALLLLRLSSTPNAHGAATISVKLLGHADNGFTMVLLAGGIRTPEMEFAKTPSKSGKMCPRKVSFSGPIRSNFLGGGLLRRGWDPESNDLTGRLCLTAKDSWPASHL